MSHDPDDPSTSTSSPNFRTIFADALQLYKKRTKEDITTHSLAAQIVSCNSPNAVLTVLQTQVQTFDPFPSANEKWTRLLAPTITVLYAFSGFVRYISGPVFPPAAAIFTGIGVLLQVAQDVRATEDIIIDLFDRMKFFFMRLEKYIAVRPTAAMTDVIGKIIVEVISILGIATKEIGQERFKKSVKKLFGIHRLEDSFQRLDKFTQEEARMAEVEILVTSNHTGLTSRIGNMSRKALRQWIDPPDWSSNFYAASDAHHEGTAAWCIDGKSFTDWMASNSESLLWIHGKPGSGKTILSSVIIRDIEFMRTAGLAILAYFYFDFKDEGKKDSRALLSSLLDQLSNQSDQLCDVLRGLYSEHEDGSKRPLHNALLRCLKDMLTIARSVPIYLVMDALDECPKYSDYRLSLSPRGIVLSLVKELVGLRLPNLHLCITSRPEWDIRAIITPLATQQISLHDESGQNRDINSYVTFVVHSVKHWQDDDKKMVIDKLTEDADGMFRWVYYKLDVLRQCHRNDLRRIIKALPQSLDETYQRTLKEINYANSKQAHRLLQCLVAAHRPLRVEELAEVLVLDVDAGGIPRFNAVWHWEDHEAAVLSTCSSLVSVVDHDGSRVVQFCHFSAKEFLMSDRLSSISSTEDISQFHISHDSSHVILAQACVGVLLRVDDPTSDDGAGLSGYAYEHWLGHVQVLLERNVDVRMHGNSGDTPLHLAASSHYLEVARMLLERNAEVNSLDDKGLTPLRRALEGVPRGPDIVRFVRLLFDNGADLHTRDKRGNTLLHFAASRGHLEVARTLLELKADVNSVNKEGLTPLHKISRMWLTRSPDIVRLLFDNGANLHVRDNSGNTPLHLAASGGHLEAARTLLELKADVNSLDGKGSTPLHRALEGVPRGPDIVRLVRLLFDNGADLHARDNSGDTPLHSAASRGHLEVTRMLLEHNAEVNPKNSHGSTPLHLASAGTGNEGGNLDVVRLLFGHGADVKAQNLNGEIASQLAHGSYQQEIVQLLSQQAVE